MKNFAQKMPWIFPRHFGDLKLHQAQNQGQCNPDSGDPLGGRSQHLIQVAGLILAQVRIGITGQSTGQTGLLAGLKQNDTDQCDAEQHLNNDQNSL